MKRFTIFLSLLGLTCFGGSLPLSKQVAFFNATPPSGTVPFLFQDFEGTGTPPSFSIFSGSPDFHNTSSPLSGAKDLLMGSDDDATVDIGALSEAWVDVEFETSANPTHDQGILYLSPLSGNYAALNVKTDGHLIVQDSASAVGSETAAAIPLNTKVYLRFHARKGTGANALIDMEWTTDGNFIGSGSHFTSFSTAGLSADMNTLDFFRSATSWANSLHFDNLKIYNTAP